MKAFIVIGTKTLGFDPNVVPSNPRGATPTIVIDCPLTVIVWLSASRKPPNCVRQ